MTVLGYQLVTTLIGACILSKIVTHFPMSRLLFTGLKRSIIPTDEQLLAASGNCKVKTKGKKRRSETNTGSTGNSSTSDMFYFPRSTPIPLQRWSIFHNEVTSLPLYSTCQWLLDFTLCSIGVYMVTEAFRWFYSDGKLSDESVYNMSSSQFTLMPFNCRLNLSLIWMALTVWFTVRSLISITSLYFHSGETHANSDSSTTRSSEEWFLVVAAGCLFLLMAGFFLALDGRYFEFKLRPAYTNLTMDIQTLSGPPWISWGAFHLTLALVCSMIGALFVYPGMKYGRLYLDAAGNPEFSLTKRVLTHLVFISPLLPICLWIKPFTDSAHQLLLKLTFKVAVLRSPTLLAVVTVLMEYLSLHLGTLQLWSCLIVVLLRLFTTRWNLQVYLDSAKRRVERLNREPGKTSNKEIQRLVASIFHCMHLVTLQWIAPTFLLLAVICLYKNTAGLTWLPISGSGNTPTDTAQSYHLATSLSLENLNLTSFDWSSLYGAITETRVVFTQITAVLATRGIAVSRGVLSFLVWWSLVAIQSVSFLGLAYHRFTSV